MSLLGPNEKLAVDGGSPIRSEPWPAWPVFDDEQIEAARAVLASGRVNYWTGEECSSFEREYAAHTGVRHAVALANGSVALELALLALAIGPGDEVIVTPRSFIASASCVVLRGARPVFVDVAADSQNITAETIEPAITPRTKAIIAVHLAGWPCDMDPILELARRHGLRVVEDCAQAHGATYKGRPVGSLGDVAAFSFCQDKIITTAGEGGMLLTDDEDIWRRAWTYKDHGKDFDAVFHRDHPPGFRWVHESIGTNGRMTEIQAAIGRVQLLRLPQWHARRRANAARLVDRLADLPALSISVPPADVGHAWYKFPLSLRLDRLRPGWTRDRIIESVNAEGVPCLAGFCPEIYREQAFEDAGLSPPHRLPVARELGETSLMLLVHPTTGQREMDDAVAAVEKVLAVSAK